MEVTDAGGNTYSEAMAITIDDAFEISQSVPTGQVTNQDTALTFTGANAITVSDGLASGDTRLQVYISTNFNGTLTLSQTTGLTIGGGSNGGTFMTMWGTESDINAAFDGMTFTPAGGYSGPVTIDVTTSLGADLQGRYEFEGNANDTGLGLVQNGTLNGATITDDGTRGDVLLLDAADEHVEIASLFNTPADVTLAAWVNLDSAIENAEIISLGNNIALRADDSGQGLAVFYYQGSGTWNTVGSVDVNLDGAGWNHVAATFDDTNNRVAVYLNGVEVANLDTTDSIDWTTDGNTSTSTFIGKHGNGSTSFDFRGRIDDARIYDRALTAGEIAALAAEQTEVADTIDVTVGTANSAPYFTSLPDGQAEVIETGLTDASVVTSADLDADGDLDLISATETGELRWHENDGTGTFSAGVLIDTEQHFNSVVAVDIDGDTDIDIVATNDDPLNADNGIFVYTNGHFGTGTVSFGELSFEGSGVTDYQGAHQVAVGDLDKNGLSDIVVTFYDSIGDSHLVVYEQETVGNWFESTVHSFTQGGYGVSLADIDGDTYLDIVTAEFNGPNQVLWFRNDQAADPTFTSNVVGTSFAVYSLDTEDLDGDGDQDIVIGSWGDNEIAWFANNGDGTSFDKQSIFTDGTSTFYDVTIADVNGDTELDVLVASSNNDEIRVFSNDGSGNFTGNLLDTHANRPEWVEAADIDGDGNADVVFASHDGNSIQVHHNEGNGGFIRGTVNEDIALGTLGVQIADEDAGAAILEVTINVTNGNIILNTASVTVLSGASSSPTITFEGTVADLNTALANLTYSPTTDFNGIGEVQITVDDRGNTGAGGALTATESLFVEVLPQPDPLTDAHYTTWIGDNEFVVNTEITGDQDSPGVTALSDGGFVVVWESDGQDTDNEGVYFQRYDAAGNAIGSETPVNTTVVEIQEAPEVTALASGGFVVIWESDGQDTNGDGIYLRVFAADGTAVTGEVPVNTHTTDDQDTPEIAALRSGGFVVVWESDEQDGDTDGIYFQRFDDAGVAQGIETRANVTTTGEQGDPRVTGTNDGGFVIAWEDRSSGDYEVVARRFDAAGASVSGEIPINTTTTG